MFLKIIVVKLGKPQYDLCPSLSTVREIMSSHIKFSRKDLKEPDQFVSMTARFFGFFRQNERALIILVATIVVVIGVVWAIDYNRRVQELRMESLLFEMKTIQEKGGDVGKLKEFLDRFGEGVHKQRARLMIAGVFYRSDQYGEAVKLYSEVVGGTRAGDINHDAAQTGLGYSYEAGKEYKKAIETYKSIIDRGTTSSLFDVYLSLARVYEDDSNNKNALLILREMENKFQGDVRFDKVREKIKKLEAQG